MSAAAAPHGAAPRRARPTKLDRYRRSLVAFQNERAQRERAWLEELLMSERAALHPAPDSLDPAVADVAASPSGGTVQRGHTLDGLGKYYRETIDESAAEPVDVVAALKDAKVDVLVSYLPVGSENADKFYAQCAIDAGVAFVNALPVFIASDPEWAAKFEEAGVPIIGDDIKSQVGATITHRVMAKLFEDRGVALDRTYQLNVGGNMDFKNMLERERLESKKISKTQAVTSNLEGSLAGKIHDENVHIGPSDYVAWLDDRKWAYVRLEGRAFGDVPLNLEYKLEVWDSPNSAGIIIDRARTAASAVRSIPRRPTS
jgi:myo-inositol-1-phosphate synthase